MTDHTKLRAAALACPDQDFRVCYRCKLLTLTWCCCAERAVFQKEATPKVVLGLLDELDRLRPKPSQLSPDLLAAAHSAEVAGLRKSLSECSATYPQFCSGCIAARARLAELGETP